MAINFKQGPGSRRGGGMTPIQTLAPPKGGPPGLYHAARRARVAEALGPALRPYLVDVKLRHGGIVLVMDGPEWEGALESSMGELQARVEAILGRPGAPVSIECRPHGALKARMSENGETETPAALPEDPLERLRRVSAEFLRLRVE